MKTAATTGLRPLSAVASDSPATALGVISVTSEAVTLAPKLIRLTASDAT